MKKNYNRLLLILSFFLFCFPLGVFAKTNASASFSGNNSVYLGDNIDVYLVVSESGSGAGEGVAGIQGPISYDSSKLELVGNEPYSLNASYGNGKVIGMVTSASSYLTGTKNVMKFTFRTKALGNATISMNADISDANGSKMSCNPSKTISIVEPPSSNNNLSSLSVSTGSINFNKNNTNYSVSVGSDVTSITINASAEDGGASVSGTGSKNLNYGNNKFDITVKAPSGATKTYSVNVNRNDNRSSNNNLSSLKVNNGTISPNFNKNTLEYNIEVPYEVSSLKIDATAEDSKSKVNISNNNLISEETVKVKVTVTAENGSSKTYTINAKRGKDPNKVLSTNNYLASLTVSQGILSPSFDKNQENYIVYLPFEIDSIEISASVEDTRYATIKVEGSNKLSVGNNVFKYKVTAEDNSVKTYTITVVRGNSLLESNLSSNVFLKNIKIKNGNLLGAFDKKINYYIYTGKIEKAEAEDENSKLKIIEKDGVVNIVVESEAGDIGVYTLVLAKKDISKIMIIAGAIGIIVVGVGIGYLIGHRKGKKEQIKKDNKKEKKETKKEEN